MTNSSSPPRLGLRRKRTREGRSLPVLRQYGMGGKGVDVACSDKGLAESGCCVVFVRRLGRTKCDDDHDRESRDMEQHLANLAVVSRDLCSSAVITEKTLMRTKEGKRSSTSRQAASISRDTRGKFRSGVLLAIHQRTSIADSRASWCALIYAMGLLKRSVSSHRQQGTPTLTPSSLTCQVGRMCSYGT